MGGGALPFIFAESDLAILSMELDGSRCGVHTLAAKTACGHDLFSVTDIYRQHSYSV